MGAIYAAYFGNLRTFTALIIPLLIITLGYLIFRRTASPRTRSWTLGLMLVSSIFLWLYIAVSLVACYALADAYEYELDFAIRTVFASAILSAIVGGIPLALILRKYSPNIVLHKVETRAANQRRVLQIFNTLAKEMGISSAQLRVSPNKVPISFALETNKPIVVMSESLLTLLKADELEAVLAHELAHIKNSDTALKAMVTAYKTALPLDPVIRLVEAAFHREREMVADETAAKATGRPLSLARALLKIYEAFPKNSLRSYGTLSILGAGSTLMSRQPPIRNRINQLIRLAESQE